MSVAKAEEELAHAETPEERWQADEQLSEATGKLKASEAALAELPLRSLSVYEHPPILNKALTEAKERLMIISPWIRKKVVNKDFLTKLESLLRNQVKLYIGYGIGDGRCDPGPVAKLQQLSANYENLKFMDFGNTHAKLLLYDRNCVCLGSFNWLSFKGDPDSPFRDEQSFLSSMAEVVDAKFSEQVKNFDDIS